jgi:hypothetical protein
MATLTIILGAALTILGVGGYFGTGRESLTALIPVLFGVPLFLLGLLALRDAMRKVAMHIAVGIAVLGFAGSVRGLISLPALLTRPEEIERPAAVGAQATMAVLCLLFVIACVASFIRARRAPSADGG